MEVIVEYQVNFRKVRTSCIIGKRRIISAGVLLHKDGNYVTGIIEFLQLPVELVNIVVKGTYNVLSYPECISPEQLFDIMPEPEFFLRAIAQRFDFVVIHNEIAVRTK